METSRRISLLARAIFVAVVMLAAWQGHAKAGDSTETVLVDKIVANPAKFKGTVKVAGKVAKTGANGLFALSCEDACVAMPVKFSGTLPAAGRDVVVRGQVRKDAGGRYIFNAESVTAKK